MFTTVRADYGQKLHHVWGSLVLLLWCAIRVRPMFGLVWGSCKDICIYMHICLPSVVRTNRRYGECLSVALVCSSGVRNLGTLDMVYVIVVRLTCAAIGTGVALCNSYLG